MSLTTHEKIQKIQAMRPIDDIFFEVLSENPKVCEEMLRTILDDPKLIVLSTVPQRSEQNIYGRSVRLDVLCVIGDGSKCNIEIQRSDNDDHLRRVRFNASSITVKESTKGDKFKDVIDLCIIYVSEFDVFGEGKTIYHVDSVIRETGTVVDDGLKRIFVNTAINDGTKVAELMSCFMQTDINNAKFPELSKEVTRLKTERGGLKAMCKVMDELIDKAVSENTIKMLLRFGASDDQIVKELQSECGLSESEAIEQIKQFKSNN